MHKYTNKSRLSEMVAVGNLIYIEFLSLMNNVYSPVRRIEIPELKSIDRFIDANRETFIECFSEESIDYIKKIPSLIREKINMMDPSNQLIREKIGSSIFKDGLSKEHIDFIVEESKLIINANDMIDMKEDFYLSDDDIVRVDNPFALFPLFLNANILDNDVVMEKIKFVNNMEYVKEDNYLIKINPNNTYKCIKCMGDDNEHVL